MPLLLGFVQEMVEDLQRKTIKTTRSSVSVLQLQELLRSENCLCGRCLDETSRNHILQQLEQLENAGQLTQDAIAQDELKIRLSLLLQYHKPNLDQILLTRDRLSDDLDNLKQEITRLKQDTEGTNQQEADEIWRKVGRSEQKMLETTHKIERLSQEIEQYKNKEKNLRQTIETLAGQDKETATLAKQVKLARGLKDAAEELIDWHIHQSKSTIEEHTTARYRQVTNKPEEYLGIEIRNNYTLGVRTLTGDLLNPEVLSAGEKEALAFSFITGLNLASNTAAPLMMDTPFGHLDIAHQKNIVKSLGQIPSQVILLATDRDFPDSLLQELQPYLAEIHHIRRLDATEDASIIES
jgi:DNA sulfur modification protein DndD